MSDASATADPVIEPTSDSAPSPPTSWRPHLAWATLGAISIPSMWYAWAWPGGVTMCLCIVAAFVMWHKLGARGSWMALIVMGLGMSGILGWQAATGSRCPEAGTKVFLKVNKPPVGCSEIRASAGSMSAFFAMIALIGIGAPIYARSMRDDDADLVVE